MTSRFCEAGSAMIASIEPSIVEAIASSVASLARETASSQN